MVVPITAAVALELWLLNPSGTIALIPMVALLECAQRVDRRRSLWMAVAVVPCVTALALVFNHGDTAHALASIGRNLGLCLLAIAAGDWLRARREASQQAADAASEQALRRIGDERLQIAHEIHDVVAHAMTAINVQAGVAAHLVDRDPAQAHDALRDIKRTSGEALDELRSTLAVLRDPSQTAPLGPSAGLDDLDPLAGGPSPSRRRRIARGRPGRRPAGRGAVDRLPDRAGGVDERRSARARVACQRARTARSGVGHDQVCDDGDGAVPGRHTAGNGVRGMQERAAAAGGVLVAGGRRTGGWRVEAILPVAGDDER